MKKPEFFHNLKYLSSTELKSFGKYLSNTCQTSMASQYNVFKIIQRNILSIQLDNTEKLKRALLRNTRYSESTLNKILSRMNDSLIAFSKIEAVKTSNYITEYSYCNYLLKHENRTLLKENIKILSEELSDNTLIEHDYFHKMFEFNILKYNESITDEENLNTTKNIEKQKYFTLEANRNLWVYTVAKSMINLTNLVFQCNGFEEFKKNEFNTILDNFFKTLREENYKQFNKNQKNIIILFRKLHIMLNNPYDTAAYIGYRNYLKFSRNKFSEELIKTHHSILMNFCFLMNRLSNDMFFKNEITHNLYYYVEKKYYINSKTMYLHPIIYKNFVINCINTGNVNLLKRFIHKYTVNLNPSDIKEMSNFAFCHFYYLNNEFSKSIDVAEKINNPKGFYKYDIYNLLIKNYFEVSNFHKAEHLIHNYKFFINSDSLLSENDKEKYLLMIDYVKSFLIYRTHYDINNDIFNFEFLLARIKDEKPFYNRLWLTAKLEEIIFNHYNRNKKYKIIS